ncbi:MAG: hypothetical protein IKR69_02020 [Bacteroidales bacterium]|nr:hypothetical protein [Bacteroidales bacterium]
MKFLGNILWLVFGGIVIALIYFIVGLLMCITIIGIPFGVQLLKLGTYALWPFGHELVNGHNEPGCLSVVRTSNPMILRCPGEAGADENCLHSREFSVIFVIGRTCSLDELAHYKLYSDEIFQICYTDHRGHYPSIMLL